MPLFSHCSFRFATPASSRQGQERNACEHLPVTATKRSLTGEVYNLYHDGEYPMGWGHRSELRKENGRGGGADSDHDGERIRAMIVADASRLLRRTIRFDR